MKSIVLLSLLLLTLFTISSAYAKSSGSNWGYGIEGGMIKGDNAGEEEEWVPAGRGFIQLGLSGYFSTQLGVSYLPLKAGEIYETNTLSADLRLLYIPFRIAPISPYLYLGAGASKDLKYEDSEICTVVPFGGGFLTRLGSRVSLDLHGGYTLATDMLDGSKRADNNLNRITNEKHDGFYNVMLGLVISSPYQKKAKIIIPDARTLDSDNDGLNDYLEMMTYYTDPKKADTDGDGVNDYDEVSFHRTDPLKIDTDGGGMYDGAEVRMGKNPLDATDDVPEPVIDLNQIDTDKDGLSDGEEMNKYRTNPKMTDTDMDGVFDGDEVIKYRSDPLKADTDMDKLSDGEEVSIFKTDPTRADTDNDGLDDYDEVKTYKTDPLSIDSDSGGLNDSAEIKANKNPLDAKDDVDAPKIEEKIVLEGITFASGSAKILRESEETLQKVYFSMQDHPEVTVLITGHTDNVGNEDSNRELSLKRAQAVKDWLVFEGIIASRIKVVGKGEAEPIASNDTKEGRAKNRRIEIEAIK